MGKNPISVMVMLIVVAFLLTACGSDSSSGDSSKKTVTISWTANKESGVNRSGGGYQIYYSTTSGFDAGSASSVDVPYESGSSAPTSVDIDLKEGTYYFRIAAYSAINTGGSGLSDEVSFTVVE